MADIQDDRPLTLEERSLISWMLANAGPEAAHFTGDLDGARVVRRCGCGCASVDLSVNGQSPPESVPMRVIADFLYKDCAGYVAGAAVFVRDGRLAGLELSCFDPRATITQLPSPDVLRPYDKATAT
jgi:hypothetical protein